MKKFGIDISEWQDGFDFDKALAEGVEFVILRGGDKLYKDRCFEGFYAACKQRKIPVGVYHFTRCTTPEAARQEAQFLIKNVLTGKQFEYPIYMDVEADAQKKVGKKQLTDTVIAYCEEIKGAGYLPGVYTSLSFLKNYLDDTRLDPYEKWIAQWYRYCEYGDNLGMWQFGGETNLIRSNKVAGVTCDQDYCYFDYPAIIKSRKLNGYQTNKKKGDFALEMRVLKVGCKGKDVRAFQILLIGNGWNGGTWGADGNFGRETEQAVLEYQRKNKLREDGMAGPETMTYILGVV
jgi:hypothetical protein